MKTAITFLMLLSTFLIQAQSRTGYSKTTCTDFKTGYFTYANNRDMKDCKIIRKNSVQIEIDTKTKAEVHTAIQWESNCDYVLSYTKFVGFDKDMSKFLGQKIHCTIIDTQGDEIEVQVNSRWTNEVITFVKEKPLD